VRAMAAVQSTERERIGHGEFRVPRARGSQGPPSVGDSEEPEGETVGMHRPSHVGLLEPVPHYRPGHKTLRLDFIVVPAARPVGSGSGLALACQFAAAKDAQLVVIRSGAAALQPFPDALVPRTTRPTIVIDLPAGAERILQWRSDEHLVASLHRDSDLGFKRNLALLLGRMRRAESMLFMDDDISATPASQIVARRRDERPRVRIGDLLSRLDDVLADFCRCGDLHAAGYFQRDMDDNSVFCHARRLVGRPQETFISGGALAVRVAGDLPPFSRVYNEDWLFFLQLMLEAPHAFPFGGVRYVGTIHQDAYHPFTVVRAQSEELGDLFAEGMFSLLSSVPREQLHVTAARPAFWEQAIDHRCEMIDGILSDLYSRSRGARNGLAVDARKAMQAASAIYTDADLNLPEILADFFSTVTEDRRMWRAILRSVTPQSTADVLSMSDSLDVLGLNGHVTYLGGNSRGRRAS
jgi:hypothetical protein